MGARCAILTGAAASALVRLGETGTARTRLEAASDEIARTLAGHDGGYRILETEPIAAAVVSTPR